MNIIYGSPNKRHFTVIDHNMKIIKQFEDLEFLDLLKIKYNYQDYKTFSWALGDDGEIYYIPPWTIFNGIVKLIGGEVIVTNILSFATMKKLVKEFGHLTPFI